MSDCTLTDKFVITRKKHQCYGCYEICPPKTKMKYSTGVFDGHFWSMYLCQICDEFMQTLDSYEFVDGFSIGDLLEYDEHPKNKMKRQIL